MENKPDTSKLQELTSKSWNLELIISGAAIFFVSYLPEWVDKGLYYYLDNWVFDRDYDKIMYPLLAIGFAKMVSWLLILAFIVHFCIRAFWVGLVGLHAVYPEGIRYDKLPGQRRVAPELLERQFGTLDAFIHRLDRLCNQVFSFAFLVALSSIGIASVYLILFAVITFAASLSNPIAKKVAMVVFIVFFLFISLVPTILGPLVKKGKLAHYPRLQRLAEAVIMYAPAMILPFVYRPMQYISMTFTSNMPRRKMTGMMVLIVTLVMLGVLITFTGIRMQMTGRLIFIPQTFFSHYQNAYMLDAARYDNLRPEGARMPLVSIPSDVVDGHFLRVFVAYPKYLDQQLTQFCTDLPTERGAARARTNAVRDSSNLDCMGRFFRVSVNDSLVTWPDWLFHTNPSTGVRGLVTYLPDKYFKPGKNLLTVRVPSVEKPDSLESLGTVPFWFDEK